MKTDAATASMQESNRQHLECAVITLGGNIYGTDVNKGKSTSLYKSDIVSAVHTYFNHIYLVGGFDPSAKKTHACLASGYWCWSNFFERPKQIVLYWRKKHVKS